MDTTLLRELLDKRDALDDEIRAVVNGLPEKKPIKCGSCGGEGHTARTCKKKDEPQ